LEIPSIVAQEEEVVVHREPQALQVETEEMVVLPEVVEEVVGQEQIQEQEEMVVQGVEVKFGFILGK
jgi:hypothetical protein